MDVFTPLTKTDLLVNILEYIDDQSQQAPNIWNVSNIKDMSSLFDGLNFDYDISAWDVSNVTNMYGMFQGSNFNHPIGSWDVSNVKNMASMFAETVFNHPIGSWDVHSVKDMNSMFFRAKMFNQPIGTWDVINVKSMLNMFLSAENFNQYIGDWDVRSVTIMRSMFESALVFNQNIGRWNVNGVEDMDSMFRGASDFFQNLTLWDSRYATFRHIFAGNTLMSESDMPGRTGAAAEPEGVAYEVHNKFHGIARDSILAIIRLPGKRMKYERPIEFYIEDAMNRFLDLFPGDVEISTRYEVVLARIRGGVRHLTINQSDKELAILTLRYVMTQPDDFKRAYMKMFVSDCAEAYGGFDVLDPHRNLSCPKGIFERVILSLGRAASIYLVEHQDATEYQKLIDVFTPITAELLNSMAAECRTTTIDVDPAEVQKIVGIYRDCIREKLMVTGKIANIDGVDNPPIFKKYINEQIRPMVVDAADEGGRQRMRRRTHKRRSSRTIAKHTRKPSHRRIKVKRRKTNKRYLSKPAR